MEHRAALEAALRRGGSTHRPWDVVDGIMAGRFFPVLGEKAFAVVEVVEHPLERQVSIWLAGGDRKALETEVLMKIERFARSIKATKLTAVARPGWMRGAEQFGFRCPLRYYEKDLRDGQEANNDAEPDHVHGD